MRRGLFLLGLAVVGCDAASRPAKFAAPVDDGGTARTASVAAARPDASDPRAEAVVTDLLVKHTKGEPKRVEGLRAHTVVRKGKWTLPTGPSDATQTGTCVWPDRFRGEIRIAALPHPLVLAFRGGAGWKLDKSGGTDAPQAVDAVALEASVADTRAEWMHTLVPLLDAANLRVALAPEFDGPGLTAVRAWVGDQPPLLLGADVKTGRLKRVRYESRQAGSGVVMEQIVGEHQWAGGVFLPATMVVTAGDKMVGDWTTIEYTFPATVDPAVFDKP